MALEDGLDPGTPTPPVGEPTPTPVEGVVEGGETSKEPTPAQAPTPAPTPASKPKTPWYMERINELTAKNKELEGKVAAPQPTPPQGKTYTQQEVEEEVLRRAGTMAQQQAAVLTLNQRFNAMYEEGKKDFGADFDGSLQRVGSALGGPDQAFMEAVLETGNGHEILRELGDNLEEVMRLKALPPIPRAVEIAKMAARVSGKKTQATKAPDPITPKVDGGGKPSELPLDDPNLPLAEFMARRNKTAGRKNGR